VRLARHGEAGRGRDLFPGLPGGADDPDLLGHDLRRDQPRGGRPVHRAGPPDPLPVKWLARSPMVLVGGLVLLAGVLASGGAPPLTAADPVKPAFSKRLARPWMLGGTPAYPLGADNLGRDIWARVLYGGRISLVLATSAVILATGAGVTVGLLAGA